MKSAILLAQLSPVGIALRIALGIGKTHMGQAFSGIYPHYPKNFEYMSIRARARTHVRIVYTLEKSWDTGDKS